MRQRLTSAIGLVVLASSPVLCEPVGVDHQAVTCIVAGTFPRLQAQIRPDAQVAAARVLFQSEGGNHWYAVSMKAEGGTLYGVLPKPLKSLKAFQYYIEVTDKALATSRTAEYTSRVASRTGDCRNQVMAVALASASVLVEAPAGAALVPAGFAATGVVPAGSAAATVGSAAAGGGGGIPAVAVVGGVVGVAGAVAAVAIASRSDGSGTVEIHGQVYATGGANNPVNPVAGAIVSTSVDGATATTDGGGQFHLVTQTAKAADDCRAFTITIVASGHPTYSVTAKWGNGWGDSGGQNLAHPFILSPAYPSAISIIKPQCP